MKTKDVRTNEKMEIYTFEDFKKDIIEAGLESMLEYKGKIYSLSIVPGKYKLFNKKKNLPLWRFYNESDDFEIIRSKNETICDEIVIDGKGLAEIWEQIKTV